MIDTMLKETEGSWGSKALLRTSALIAYLVLLHGPWPPWDRRLAGLVSRVEAWSLPRGLLALLLSALVLLIVNLVLRYIAPRLVGILSGQGITPSLLRRWFARKLEREVRRAKTHPETLEDLRLRYPEDEKELRPTRLGNILRSAELYAPTRYEMETSILWPRLLHLLSDRDLKTLDDERDSLFFFVQMSLVSILSAVGWCFSLPLAGLGPPWPLVLAVLLAGYLFYRLALQPAKVYAQLMRVYFDLYRRALGKALGCPESHNLQEEQEIWRLTSYYLLTGDAKPEDLARLFSGRPEGSDDGPAAPAH